mmetsp:Transcript_19738/g.31995  ORF Transcript_19738/g.31995 Transcript_19738/m.31995 type:complete len:304 (-) Transcript_19738:144-1055(-)
MGEKGLAGVAPTIVVNIDAAVETPKPEPQRAVEATAAVTAAPATSSDRGGVGDGQKKGVAFFDLDHTIIDTNSSWHWMQHEIHNGRVGAGFFFTALYWFARYAAGFGAGAERAGAEAAELYAGTAEEELQHEVERFFHKELAHRMRPGCAPVMHKHAAAGERCIICTSSWQHPARSAARLFDCETDPADVISSVMEVDAAGMLSGKIAKVAFGDGKYHVTKEWADANDVDLMQCHFYTDSMSDVLLMEKVGFPIAVNPDARLRAHAKERGWEIHDWGIAESQMKKPRYSYGCLNFSGAAAGPG